VTGEYDRPDLVWTSPPGWPPAPEGFVPPAGWQPDPSWPPAPEGWQFWQPRAADLGRTSEAAYGRMPTADFAGAVEESGAQQPSSTPPDAAAWLRSSWHEAVQWFRRQDRARRLLILLAIPIVILFVVGSVIAGIAHSGPDKNSHSYKLGYASGAVLADSGAQRGDEGICQGALQILVNQGQHFDMRDAVAGCKDAIDGKPAPY
jgi:hypothetical protein